MMYLKRIWSHILSLPAPGKVVEHYLIAFGILAYLGILFLVLKAFQYNKDEFEN